MCLCKEMNPICLHCHLGQKPNYSFKNNLINLTLSGFMALAEFSFMAFEIPSVICYKNVDCTYSMRHSARFHS